MGLDMYLYAKKHLWYTKDGLDISQKNLLVQDLRDAGVLEQTTPFGLGFALRNISVQAAYWRKANAIHAWFVDNIQDGEDNCDEYEVSRVSLIQLKEECQKVLLLPSTAADVLPSQEGFFFGPVEYDEWYFDCLRETVTQLTEALKYPDTWDFYYRASW